MTWQNLPCAPTLPALFAACPHGWAEIEFTYQAGNPTADPPQDADCSIGFGRVWGIDHEDLRGGPCRPPVLDHDVLLDLCEPPLGVPHRDFVLLARVVHRAGPCNMCGRKRGPDEQGWSCFAGDWDAEPLSCPGTFPFECTLETSWGVDGKPVMFVGATPVYKPHPDPKPGRGDMWQQVIDRERGNISKPILACFERRRSDGIAQYATPLQAGNGRDAFREVLDETLDRIAYIEQALTERPELERSGTLAYLRQQQRGDIAMVGILLVDIAEIGG